MAWTDVRSDGAEPLPPAVPHSYPVRPRPHRDLDTLRLPSSLAGIPVVRHGGNRRGSHRRRRGQGRGEPGPVGGIGGEGRLRRRHIEQVHQVVAWGYPVPSPDEAGADPPGSARAGCAAPDGRLPLLRPRLRHTSHQGPADREPPTLAHGRASGFRQPQSGTVVVRQAGWEAGIRQESEAGEAGPDEGLPEAASRITGGRILLPGCPDR